MNKFKEFNAYEIEYGRMYKEERLPDYEQFCIVVVISNVYPSLEEMDVFLENDMKENGYDCVWSITPITNYDWKNNKEYYFGRNYFVFIE